MSYNKLGTSISSSVPMARNNICCAVGTSLIGNTNSFFECLMLISGGLLKKQHNGGLPGQNSSYIGEREYLNALWWKPGIVFLIPSFNGAGTYASTQVGMQRMIAEIRKSGALCVCLTEPTQGGSVNLTYNSWLKSYVAGLNDPGCIVSDLAAVLFASGGTGTYNGIWTGTGTNTSALQGAPATYTVGSTTGLVVGYALATGVWVQSIISSTQFTAVSEIGGISANATSTNYTAYQYMQDITHPNTNGGMAVAKQIMLDLATAGFLNGMAPFTALDSLDYGNLIANGTLEGSVSGGLASGFSTTISSSYLSVVTDSNFRGYCQQISLPAGYSVPGNIYFGGANVRAYRGRKLAFSVKMSISGVQLAGTYYTLSAALDQSPPALPSTFNSNNVSNFIFMQTPDFEGQGMVFYAEAVVPDNATSFSCYLSITSPSSGAPNIVVIKIGEISLIDIDDPEKPVIRRQKSMDVLSANTTLDTTYETVLVNAASGALNITLPTASNSIKGKEYTIKKTDSSANAVTIVGTVDGTTNPTLANQYASKTVACDGTIWQLINAYLT